MDSIAIEKELNDLRRENQRLKNHEFAVIICAILVVINNLILVAQLIG